MKTNLPEDAQADLLGFALSVRHERVLDAHWAAQSAEVRDALRETVETLAMIGLAQKPIAPSAGLRDRIMKTLEGRAKPVRKALLVIDMINDHLAPGCALEVPRAREIVAALKSRLDAARKSGVPVVYVVDEHDPDDEDLDTWGTHAVRGSKGAEVWPELAPQKGDRIVKKPTYSAFNRSNLAEVLDELAVDTLELTGCLTELGVLATATDAFQRGFDIQVPPTTQAGSSQGAEQVAMGVIGFMEPYGPARKARLAALAKPIEKNA